MSLPYLYARPEDEEGWNAWSFNHAANHYTWVSAIGRVTTAGGAVKFLVQQQQFILSPIDPNDLGMWLYQHQTAHDQANEALGTKGYNLLELDWKDPDQFATWLRLNGDEHIRISAALGVS